MYNQFTLSETSPLLAAQGKDPVTGEVFKVGDNAVFCASCQSAFLEDSWKYMGEKHCGQDKTLSEEPQNKVLDLNWKPSQIFKKVKAKISLRVSNWKNHLIYFLTMGMTNLLISFFFDIELSYTWILSVILPVSLTRIVKKNLESNENLTFYENAIELKLLSKKTLIKDREIKEVVIFSHSTKTISCQTILIEKHDGKKLILETNFYDLDMLQMIKNFAARTPTVFLINNNYNLFLLKNYLEVETFANFRVNPTNNPFIYTEKDYFETNLGKIQHFTCENFFPNKMALDFDSLVTHYGLNKGDIKDIYIFLYTFPTLAFSFYYLPTLGFMLLVNLFIALVVGVFNDGFHGSPPFEEELTGLAFCENGFYVKRKGLTHAIRYDEIKKIYLHFEVSQDTLIEDMKQVGLLKMFISYHNGEDLEIFLSNVWDYTERTAVILNFIDGVSNTNIVIYNNDNDELKHWASFQETQKAHVLLNF